MEAKKKIEEERKSKGWGWCLLVMLIAALVAAAVVLTIWKNFDHFQKVSHSHHRRHGPIVKKYADALETALQFFDVQKSGKLVNNRITWRGDSGMRDGKEEGIDLSKGMYDAGDLVKFGFPMAFTATVLSWAILEYGDRMNEINQLGYAQDSLKWITDFLINAHPSPNVLYIQVGDPEVDHNCWERPETMTQKRPITQVNATFPGTEVAAETAAAMASASLVFKGINSSYSELLLRHAQELFSFADAYRGSYSLSIPTMQKYYNSSGFGDELLWAASWLYHATRDESYLKYATELNGKGFANWGSPTWFSWDDKHPATQVLLSRMIILGTKGMSFEENIGLQMYRKTAESTMCSLLPDSPTATSSRTQSGLIWLSTANSLLHPVASAFLAVLFSDYMATAQIASLYCRGKFYSPTDLRNFSISQADYVLGNNPMRMSYLVGYGDYYPQFVHHRGSSIPTYATTKCRDGFIWLDSIYPNPNVAVGALVGGPFLNETYVDYRRNSVQGEPTTYNSALLVGLLSGLVTSSSVVQSFT